jgi:hypothetical protein
MSKVEARARLWDASSLEDRVQELYVRAKKNEANRSGELLLAFSLGVATLLAFAAIAGLGIFRTSRQRLTTSRSTSRSIAQDSEMGCCQTNGLIENTVVSLDAIGEYTDFTLEGTYHSESDEELILAGEEESLPSLGGNVARRDSRESARRLLDA